MVLFNYAIREITAKIVYYGPGLCGKTTNLQFIHEKLDPGARGKLLSLATDGDRTLFFDFLPIEVGNINGYKVRFQLYTVPGQVHYNATRKLVLKGVDAVVFVADSQVSMVERNRESFENLVENLAENGYELARVPVVVQLNKRDLPNVASTGELVAAMGVEGFPVHEAVAYRGDGVFETLKTVIKVTLGRLKSQFEAESGGARAAAVPAPAPPPPAAVFAAPPPPPPPAPPPPPPPPPPPRVAPPPPVGPPAYAVPPPPPPAAVFTPPPAPAAEAYEEFDLEEYHEPPPPEAFAPAQADAGADVIDLEHEAFPAGGGFGEEAEPLQPAEPVADEFGEGWADVAEPLAAEESGGAGDWGGAAAEPPPWALEMQEELRRLRAENERLRGALSGFSTLFDRQIAALQEAQEELARGLAGDAPEEEGP